jgi:hypothetical protein
MNAARASTSSAASKAAWICLAIAWVCFLLPLPGVGLFVGWPLNGVAFVLAIVAMAKGGAMAGLIQLIASLIVSPIVYFVGVTLLLGAMGAGASSTEVQTQSAVLEAHEEAAYEVSLGLAGTRNDVGRRPDLLLPSGPRILVGGPFGLQVAQGGGDRHHLVS